MRLRDAKKLHNEDEVTLKETGAVCRVIAATPTQDKKLIMIELCEPGGAYKVVSHTEVK